MGSLLRAEAPYCPVGTRAWSSENQFWTKITSSQLPAPSERVAPDRWKLFDSIEVFYKQVNRPD